MKAKTKWVGILAQPIELRPRVHANPAQPPKFAYHISDQEWEAGIDRDNDRWFADFNDRVDALCVHFGVRRDDPYWQHDLLYGLIVTELPEYLSPDKVRIADLYADAGVKRDLPGAEFMLILWIARRRIPGFREVVDGKRPPGQQWATEDVSTFVVCVGNIVERLKLPIDGEHQQAVIVKLRDKAWLKDNLGQAWADDIARILKQYSRGGKTIADSTLFKLLTEIRLAPKAMADGSATFFQWQVAAARNQLGWARDLALKSRKLHTLQ